MSEPTCDAKREQPELEEWEAELRLCLGLAFKAGRDYEAAAFPSRESEIARIEDDQNTERTVAVVRRALDERQAATWRHAEADTKKRAEEFGHYAAAAEKRAGRRP